MAKTILNVKTDKEVKAQAQEVAKELGLPLSTVVNAFLKQFIRDKRVVFSTPHTMTPYLERVVARAEKDRKTGRNVSGPFTTAEEMRKHLASLRK